MSMGQQPQTRRAIREAQRRQRSVMPFLIGVLAIVVLGAAVWFGKGLFSGSPTGAASQIPGAAGSSTPATPSATATDGTSAPTDTATQPSESDTMTAAMESCRKAWGLRVAARDDAAAALGLWNRHLAIMNDLQAGKIDLATAKARWPATTAEAPAKIAAFHSADQALSASTEACAVDAAATGADADAVRQCATSMKTIEGVLGPARAAIAPWETHLKDQSHFKAGEITPAAAEAKWRALWQKGLATMPAYLSAAPKAQAAACSLPA
jgi:hypothetical protein